MAFYPLLYITLYRSLEFNFGYCTHIYVAEISLLHDPRISSFLFSNNFIKFNFLWPREYKIWGRPFKRLCRNRTTGLMILKKKKRKIVNIVYFLFVNIKKMLKKNYIVQAIQHWHKDTVLISSIYKIFLPKENFGPIWTINFILRTINFSLYKLSRTKSSLTWFQVNQVWKSSLKIVSRKSSRPTTEWAVCAVRCTVALVLYINYCI